MQSNIEIDHLRIYPIKALCAVMPDQIEVSPNGGIKYDREWAMMDHKNLYINGKSCAKVHHIRLVNFTPPSTFTLVNQFDQEEVTFDFFKQKSDAEAWLRKVVEKPTLRLVHKSENTPGFTDDPRFDGPTIVSMSSIKAVASWFEIDETNVLDRFRPNIVVKGAPAFWEDLLVSSNPSLGYRYTIIGNDNKDSIDLLGLYPIHRCIVPTRAPSSSEEPGKTTPDFINKFQQYRIENFHKDAPIKRLTDAKPPRQSYYLCTASAILMTGKISVGNILIVKNEAPLRGYVESVIHPSLSKDYYLRMVNNAHAIRDLPQSTLSFLQLAIKLLPVEIAGFIITYSQPDTVRKPNSKELTIGLLQIALIFVGIFFVLSRLF
eukprot:TRINITY_DN12017_c0_g1_i1.p1 TRINITY_DN12017_c0_g1~~TRINITY_DN12017_c0_g1_i1.p1  ORF type:complete len:376 (-),score=55.73 TRINITY_DN12017_c0_g1_i1:43-1170(-)